MQTNWFKVGICTSQHTTFVAVAFIPIPSAHASPCFPSVQLLFWLLDSEFPALNSSRDHHLLFLLCDVTICPDFVFLIRHPSCQACGIICCLQQPNRSHYWCVGKTCKFLELNFDSVLHQDANTTSTLPARRLDRAASNKAKTETV